MAQNMEEKVAVLVPCYNEAAAIGDVVAAFKNELPNATIWVFDNNSTDGTSNVAEEAGAIVRQASYQGKGNVVRKMFADVDADIYIMVDGDGTYDAPSVHKLLDEYRRNEVDMVNGARVTSIDEAYRSGHRLGNWALTSLVASIFGRQFQDMLSGYRVFSRRFVKSFPAASRGFEIETELTIHALELRMSTSEVETPYYARPEGSESKLNTLSDGWRILMMIGKLVKEERPLQLFFSLFLISVLLSTALAFPIVTTFIETGEVPRFPTAILSTGIMILGFLFMAIGLILDTVTRGRQETKRLHYLHWPTPNNLK